MKKSNLKKLNLDKRTISNLMMREMNRIAGAVRHTYTCEITDYCTRHCNTLHGHNCN